MPADPVAHRPRMLLTTHYWHPHTGGIETVAAAHARALQSRGWVVQAHSSRTDRESAAFEADGEFVLHRHPVFNPLERVARVPVPFPRAGVRQKLTAAAFRSDVVMAHGHVYPMTVAAANAARRTKRPFVLMQHNPWVSYPSPIEIVERLADRHIGKRMFEQATVVLCVSEHTEQYVRSIAPQATTRVLTNGVDLARFRPGALPRQTADVRFVCVRRLVPRNGVDTLLHAWAHAAVNDRAELIIAGDGPERLKLERIASTMRGVTFEGRVSDDRLIQLLQSADASIVPTRSGEGFGLVAAESHACGTPVIATDQGALREVVRDGVDGMVVRTDDPAALAAAIRSFTNEPMLRLRLTDGAMHTDWSWERVGDQLDQVLRKVVQWRPSYA